MNEKDLKDEFELEWDEWERVNEYMREHEGINNFKAYCKAKELLTKLVSAEQAQIPWWDGGTGG